MPSALFAAASAKPVADVSVGHALLQMVLALAVIVGSILLLTKFLARIRGGGKLATKRQQGAKGLTILSRQSLGKDLSIAAVRWGDREVLVGISGSTITFLNDARADERSDSGLAGDAEAAPAPAAAPFSPALLATVARGFTAPALAPAPSGRRGSFLEHLRDATVRR